MREIVLDTETTGLNPKSGDRVVEIGCVELVNHVATGKFYQQFINPGRDMPVEAFNVHGLSEEFLAGYPVFADIIDAFVKFVDGATLVIHNASFDMNFLNAEFRSAKKPLLDPDRVIDSLDLARRKHPYGPNSLDALCRRYGVDNSGRTKHGALLDSELLAEVYLELIGGRQPHLTLVEDTNETANDIVARQARPRPAPLPPRLTAAERQTHEVFIAALGGEPIWNR